MVFTLLIFSGCGASKVEINRTSAVQLPNIYFEQTSEILGNGTNKELDYERETTEFHVERGISAGQKSQHPTIRVIDARKRTNQNLGKGLGKIQLFDTTAPMEIRKRVAHQPTDQPVQKTAYNKNSAIMGLILNGLVFAAGLGLWIGVGFGLGPGMGLYWFLYVFLGLPILIIGFITTLAGFFRMKKPNTQLTQFYLTIISLVARLVSLILKYLTLNA